MLSLLCVAAPAGHPAHEIEVLEQVLGKLSTLHMSKNVKKNQVPFNLPQIDPKIVSGSAGPSMELQAGHLSVCHFHHALGL